MRYVHLQEGEGYRVVMSEGALNNHSTPRVFKYFPFSEYPNRGDTLKAAQSYRDSVFPEHHAQRYGRNELDNRTSELTPEQAGFYEALMAEIIRVAEPGVTARKTVRYRKITGNYVLYLYARSTWRETGCAGERSTKYKDFRVAAADQIEVQVRQAILHRRAMESDLQHQN